ncbi:MAG TPA: Uma2 family endonuclease [Gemmatimonadaceae bacterium]
MPAVDLRRRWTAREVRQLTADAPGWWPRYELIDGELIVTPSPGGPHQFAVTELLFALKGYCDAHGVGMALTSPADIELEPESVRQPDVFVLPLEEGKRVAREDFPARELILAVEVVSPSTANVDRGIKRELFQRRVSEYWVVDTDTRIVERWRPNNVAAEILTEQLAWQPAGATAPLILDLVALFRRAHAED